MKKTKQCSTPKTQVQKPAKKQAKKPAKKQAKKPAKKSDFLAKWEEEYGRCLVLEKKVAGAESMLKRLKEIRAPKNVIEGQARLIKEYKAEFKEVSKSLRKRDMAAKRLLRLIFKGEE